MRAYERLLRYVTVYTTSDPNSGTHPSTLRQFDLARQLVQELKDLGLRDAHVDEHCPDRKMPRPWALLPMWIRQMTPAAKT